MSAATTHENQLPYNKNRPPLARATRWRWQDYSWAAYQLPDGEIVMSDRQMSRQMRQSKKAAKEFIKQERLPTKPIRIPNGQTIYALNLRAVACYWEYLLENNLIPKTKDEINWDELLKFLHSSTPETSGYKLPKQRNEYDEDYLQVVPAKSIYLKIKDDSYLEVLVLQDGEYRISCEAGLKAIDSFNNWLEELKNSKRLKKLKERGFSGLFKSCQVETKTGNKIIKTLSIDDWLTIWEYFALHSNAKAGYLLKTLAKKTIWQRVSEVLPGNKDLSPKV